MFCSKCGKKNPKDSVYCSNCGEKISVPTKRIKKRDTIRTDLKEKTAPQKGNKIRCPNPECNILFELEDGQKECNYCGTSLFDKYKNRKRGKIYCSVCSKEITGDKYHVVSPEKADEEETYFHLDCADLVDQALYEETQKINYLSAIGCGVLFGLIAAIIWYLSAIMSGYKWGVIAIVVGWLVAKGVSVGAGYKTGRNIQIISVLITAASLFLSEYLITNHFFQEYLAEEGMRGFSLSITEFPAILIESLSGEESGLDLLFWGIALFEAFVIPGRRKLRGYKV